MNVNDVFAPQRYPQENYIERGEQIDHSQVNSSLQVGGIQVVGPSDSGRSSLVEHHLENHHPLVVDGQQVTTVGDIFSHLLNSLITKPVPERHELTETDLQSITRSEKLVRGAVKDRIGTGQYALVFDDFDEMPTDVREYVADWVSPYTEREISLAIVGKSENEHEVSHSHPKLCDQLDTIRVPEWNKKELIQIGKLGFEAVETPMDEPTLESLADLAEGSPTKMHELCLSTFIDIATEREYDVGQEYLPSGVK